MTRIVHFVGFNGEEYWSAVKAFGHPHYIHRGWDLRAQREISDDDLVVFAQGEYDQEPRVKSYSDIVEIDLGGEETSQKALRTRRHHQRMARQR